MLLLWFSPPGRATDPIDKVAALIKQNNVKALSDLFAPNIDLTLLDDESIYSKTQAALIIEKFFEKNRPRTIRVLHKINSSRNYHFGVLLVNTDRGDYRIAFTLKDSNKGQLLIEFRIETEKVK